jgi:Spy/CpxP family protein refolding chaperone
MQAVLLCGTLAGLSVAHADPQHMDGAMGHPGVAAAMGLHHHGDAAPAKAYGGHGHEPQASWRASLTDDQKGEISFSKLRLRQKQALVEAGIALKQAEIDRLVTSDEAGDEQLQQAVDALLALQREQALNRYRHLVEVRQLLTPQQRIAFDLGILSRGEGGHGH